ncbi:MAG: hypothetical protein J6P57_04145 [Lachnospiraceae bacterium]|nr:hypothetical protein [Lachnospiraceae bacterium]
MINKNNYNNTQGYKRITIRIVICMTVLMCAFFCLINNTFNYTSYALDDSEEKIYEYDEPG